MRKQNFTALVLFFALSSVNANPCCYPCKQQEPQYLVLFGVGQSSSRVAQFNPDLRFWDPAPETYHSDLGHSVLYTGGFGFHFSRCFTLDAEVTERPSFEYEKFQSPPSGSQPGFIGTKTRFFDFNETSVMANATLNGRCFSCLNWNLNCVNVTPFIGGGLGVSYNRVTNFHAELSETVIVHNGDSEPVDTGINRIASTGNDITHTDFAWQWEAGLDVALTSHITMQIGYRYFNGGDVLTSDYVDNAKDSITVSTAAGEQSIVILQAFKAPPWEAKFKTNEIFLNLIYSFAL